MPDMYEPLSRFDVTVTVGCEDSAGPDPATFAVAADRAAWGRSASIISAHLADKIISVVTVMAPDRYAAAAVARAVVSDALKRQALPSSQSVDERAHQHAQVRSTAYSSTPLAGIVTATTADLRGRSWQQAHADGLRAAGSFAAYAPPRRPIPRGQQWS